MTAVEDRSTSGVLLSTSDDRRVRVTTRGPLAGGRRGAIPGVPSIRPHHLVPAALVVVLALVGPVLDRPDPCASTDGPQFRCWLERNP